MKRRKEVGMICPTCHQRLPRDQQPDLRSLTSRQRKIYDYIRQHIIECGYPPTIREIGDGFAIRSPNGVMCHLRALERKGVILRDEDVARGIKLVS